MKLCGRSSSPLALLVVASLCSGAPAAAVKENDDSVPLPFLRAQNAIIVNSQGEPVLLRGCNLGNWLLLEMWMMEMWRADDPKDHWEVEELFKARFGETERNRLLDLWRENWIKPRDFEIIKSWGFNVVRVPFYYGMLEDDTAPGKVRDEGFHWLDRAVDMAAKAGLYVILDMHGAPGGQSMDHSTGHSGQNKLWQPENRQRAVSLWKQIAQRYSENSAVAAYELLNEPYGASSDKVLAGTMDELIRAVREVDRRHIIFCSGSLRGTVTYGPPVSHGWENVGYTEHFYPGLYGGVPALETHAKFLSTNLRRQTELMHTWNAPFLVGEFNVVFEKAGGAAMMRRYFDFFAANKWAATLWSYKLIKADGGVHPDNWYMVTNRDSLSIPHFRTAAKEEIADFFKSVGSKPYDQDDELREVLSKPAFAEIKLYKYPRLSVTAPHEALDEWTSSDIGEPFAQGGQHVLAGGGTEVFGGGRDVYEGRDEFHFVSRGAGESFNLSAFVTPPFDTHAYAKAGLMFRSGLEADACLVMVALTPNGICTFAYRRRPAERITEVRMAGPDEAKALRLRRKGSRFEATALNKDSQPIAVQTADVPEMSGKGALGLFVCSHEVLLLSKATFSQIQSK
jgi:glucan 1,3-beta-glucosidase